PTSPTTIYIFMYVFFFSSRRRHTRSKRDWSSDVCSSDLSESAPVQSRKAPSIKYSHISLIESHMTQNNFTSAAINVTSTKTGRTNTEYNATYPKRSRTSAE